MRERIAAFFLILVSFLSSNITAGQAQSTDSSTPDFTLLKIRLNTAVNHANREDLLKVKQEFNSYLGSSDKEMRKLAHYYAGYANYRLSSLFEDMGKDQKQDYLDDAIKQLKKVTETAPEFAEGWALLGNCYGMKATGLFSGMKYGPKSDGAIKKALQLSPENPRVVTISGISLLYKPAIVGGSIEKAITEFKKAAVLYREEAARAEIYPDWGQAENYAWLAQAYIRQEQYEEAIRAYEEALQIDPDYYWVEEVLLPELKEKLD